MQGFDFAWCATGFEILPGRMKLRAMLECPLDHKTESAGVHLASENFKGPNCEGHFLTTILGVEVRQPMGSLAGAKGDLDSEEFAEFWH